MDIERIKQNIIKTFGFIITSVFVISFLNINIALSNDNITSIWCYIWKPHNKYLFMTIVCYIGILLAFAPYLKKFQKLNINIKFLKFIGMFILWIVFIIFLPKVWHWQRYDMLNYQLTFFISTCILIIGDIKHFRLY